MWRLLAGLNAPVVIALLQELLLEGEKIMASSVLVERLARALVELRAAGEDLPQTAQAYIADWLEQGFLIRRLPAGASEEQYELSSDAAHAIRFVSSLRERRVLATESRLSTVMQQLLKLAEETDSNPETRVGSLLAERERIDREIENVRKRGVTLLGNERALERAREIIALADELAADFRRVRDDFDQLNRRLRHMLVENEGSRGDVLESLFAGIDIIGESEAGRTFSGFWRLLTAPEESEALREAIDALSNRPFARNLQPRERKFLVQLTSLLVDEGSRVHEVLQHFARSLKSFVQSREFLEQRRLHILLRHATQAALAIHDVVRPTRDLEYELSLTSSRVRSVSQFALYNPTERVVDSAIRDAESSELDLATVSALVRESEIDFRTLRHNLRVLLEQHPQVTIAQVLDQFPAEQGLGSIVGYVALGAKHGECTDQVETVTWRGIDELRRRARIPAIYFSRECIHEFVD
ncbi:DUF3375 domain-containing protein [Corallococcus sp. M34]|nr:DUF3375 domain-containing protein [Citreicoccus inhibens]